MIIRKMNLREVIACGGGGPSISGYINSFDGIIEELTTIKGELTSSVLSDTNYSVSKLATRVTNAANELQTAKAAFNAANNKLKNNKF